MKKILLLLGLSLFQLAIFADSGDAKKDEKQDQESKEIQDTIKSVFGKPELYDIPVPKGFKLLEESFVHKASSFRLGRVYLEGSLVIDETENFYVNQMSIAGWEKQEFEKTEKTFFKFTKYRLQFAKDRQICTIEIGRNSSKDITRIFMNLKPASLK